MSYSNLPYIRFIYAMITSMFLLLASAAFSQDINQAVSLFQVDQLSIKLHPTNRVDAVSELTLSTSVNQFTLLIQPNVSFVSNLESKSVNDIVFYEGTVNGEDDTWVRLSYAKGIYYGAFYDGNELFFVNTLRSIRPALSPVQSTRLFKQSNDSQMLYAASDIKMLGACALEAHDHDTTAFDYQNFVDELNIAANSMATREIKVAV